LSHMWRLYRQPLSVPSVHFGCPLCTVIPIRLKVVSVWCHCLADAVLRHDGLEFSGTRVDVSPSLGLNAGELFVACLTFVFLTFSWSQHRVARQLNSLPVAFLYFSGHFFFAPLPPLPYSFFKFYLLLFFCIYILFTFVAISFISCFYFIYFYTT
jgi:hypothetical protein